MATTTMVRMMQSTSSSLKDPSSRLHAVALLQSVEPGVEALRGQELFVGAVLRDAAILEHQDSVHVAHEPELVRYDEGSAAFGQGAPALLDGVRGLGVEPGLGLVQDQDQALPQHRPRDGDALPLAPAQALPTLGEQRVVAFRQLPNKAVCPGEPGCVLDLLPRRSGLPVADVLRHRRPEEHRLLRHEGYLVPQRLERELSYVFFIYEHPSSLRVVEAGGEARHGGLAPPPPAHQG